jgi:hypothetical protein
MTTIFKRLAIGAAAAISGLMPVSVKPSTPEPVARESYDFQDWEDCDPVCVASPIRTETASRYDGPRVPLEDQLVELQKMRGKGVRFAPAAFTAGAEYDRFVALRTRDE